ncbi:hypothetical protein ACO0LL_27340 [Undibacterium sp. TC4M20W]|uniref:hypothetical protein n=1 Tax=Undibacterium sp. TC4M20W TaxID=3413052 RepID=UPI003BF34AE8
MDEDKNKNFLLLIFSLVESKYVSVAEINNLASVASELEVMPEFWLTELAACQTADEAQNILREQMRDQHVIFNERYVSLLLGFSYLGVQEGKISLAEFEAELVDVMDAYSVHNAYMNMTIEDFHHDFFSLSCLPDQSTALGSYLIDAAEKSKIEFRAEIAPILSA